MEQWPPRARGVHDAWSCWRVVWCGGASSKQQVRLNRQKSPKIAKEIFWPKRID